MGQPDTGKEQLGVGQPDTGKEQLGAATGLELLPENLSVKLLVWGLSLMEHLSLLFYQTYLDHFGWVWLSYISWCEV